MSGEELRRASVVNNTDSMRELLTNKANACSVDLYGLSALHYAVWNGNYECVRMLVMNPRGVTVEGKRSTCLDLQSSIGYSALHLAAIDCPKRAVRECVFALLLGGIDPKLQDNNGQTAYALAKGHENQDFIDAFTEYVDARKGTRESSYLKALQEKLKSNYVFHAPKAEPSSPKKKKKGQGDERGFDMPDFVEEKARVGEKPEELQIREHVMRPLVEEGKEMKGVSSLKCLAFVKEEAVKNIARREKLVQQSEPKLPPIKVPRIISLENS